MYDHLILAYIHLYSGPGCIVGIATRYGLYGPEAETR